jgi:hypothetical protein
MGHRNGTAPEKLSGRTLLTMTSTLTEPALTAPGPPSPAPPRRPSTVNRLLRGRPDDPVWVRPALLALLFGTALLYLWGLGASGWANSFYSAAVQAGSASWKAFFFGSSDAANSITVDKTPASLWVMALSVRIFGLSSWSILVPQALMGVGAVGLLYATVRRWSGVVAGLLAGAILATTPVAVLMFRFDNPTADQGQSHRSRANTREKEIQPRAFALDRREEGARSARARKRGVGSQGWHRVGRCGAEGRHGGWSP